MVWPFGMRDILLVRALQEEGVSLDLETTVLHPRRPVWDAVLSQVPLNSYGAATYVVRDRDLAGFVQAQKGRNSTENYLTFMAPALSRHGSASRVWQQLLEALCQGEGERGVQRIFAKLPAQAEAEVDVFRQVGFRVYTQEHVFVLPQPEPDDVSAGPVRLRPWESKDTWGVHRLYCTGAPRFVQQAEHLPGEIGQAATSDWTQGKHEERYVWIRDSEIVASVQLLSGEQGHWMYLLLHPDQIEHAPVLIDSGIARLARYAPRPVYCVVRTYETDLRRALKNAGFQEYQIRFLLVNQTAVPIRQKEIERLPRVEGVEAAPTASTRMNSRSRREKPRPVHSEALRETQ
ncbi:MAG: hypothetical protein MAG451_00395 [Anaerolineales bacterium]|nr:hypothetical protein [Anaerolineales bacterium]